MDYDINRPWLTLDKWQKEYVYDDNAEQDNFLLACRQGGKTTAMSLRAVELCINHFKKGEFVLLNSITEKQAYHLLMKCLVYAREKYNAKVIWTGKDKPTMHKIMFTNGTGILCYAAGETGEGQRGFTIKKVMIDEGSRMSEEYFIATMPMLSVTHGSMDIGSTPNGKRHKDGREKFFYKCSKDDKFKKYYINAADCPRHDQDFLARQRERMSKLAYAQEYEAVFTDELRQVFDIDLLKQVCVLEGNQKGHGEFFLGVDVAGLGEDDCTYEILEEGGDEVLRQRENIVEKRNYTTDTTRKIKELDAVYEFNRIGIDDGGVGFGVYSELTQDNPDMDKKTIALNNASRPIDSEDGKKKLLKEEMYMNLLVLMENKKILLLKDEEVINSLASMQHDEGRIFGYNSHISEGIIRAAYVAIRYKSLKLKVRSIKV